MANYSSALLYAANTTAMHTAGAIWCGATARRIQAYEIEMGQMGVYATTDAPMQWEVSRFGATAAMAGTGTVVSSYDPADSQTALTLAIQNVTTEPTYTTQGNGLSLKTWAINQRGSYRWRALDDGDNIIVPATAGFGLGVRSMSITSGYTSSSVGTISFIER